MVGHWWLVGRCWEMAALEPCGTRLGAKKKDDVDVERKRESAGLAAECSVG